MRQYRGNRLPYQKYLLSEYSPFLAVLPFLYQFLVLALYSPFLPVPVLQINLPALPLKLPPQLFLPSAVPAHSHNVPHISVLPSAERPSPPLFLYCRLMTASGHNRRLLKTKHHKPPCPLIFCQRPQWQPPRYPHSSRPHLSWTAHRRFLPQQTSPQAFQPVPFHCH